MSSPVTERSIDLGAQQVGLLECGPQRGPLALLLHGFPDTAWTWRHLLPVLAEAGFHGVAPALRGYAPSSLASDGCYALGALVDDVVRLHEGLGGDEEAVIVGHDWGGAAAYGAASFAPERFRRVVGLAIPPAGAFVQALFRFDQLRRSFYMFFFATPFADAVVAADEMAFLARLWTEWSPGYDASFDLAKVREALGEPERLAAALSYYRAMFDLGNVPAELAAASAAALGAVPQPTLYLHGRDDGCLGAEVVEDPGLRATIEGLLGAGSRLEVLDGVGHFLHLEQPATVNALVTSWLTDPGSPRE